MNDDIYIEAALSVPEYSNIKLSKLKSKVDKEFHIRGDTRPFYVHMTVQVIHLPWH